MNLDIKNWKDFPVHQVFTNFETGKISNASDLDEGNDLPYLGAKRDDNGVMQMCADIPEKRSKGKCVVMICDGEGSVGYANYMDSDFLGTVNLMLGYNEKHLNYYTGIFLATILSQERPKYSFGRKWKTHIFETTIKLPADLFGNPDWQFMEDYIKSLHYKPLITKNKKGQTPDLDVQNWNEFKVGDLFEVVGSTTTPLEDLEEIGKGRYPYVTTSMSENGIGGFYDKRTEAGNIICIESACAAFATYQPEDFTASDHVEKCVPKFLLNPCIALFMVTILNLDQYKYSYGRKCNQIRIRDRVIKLPVDIEGNPDWQFMENYIKALPYGDRLEI